MHMHKREARELLTTFCYLPNAMRTVCRKGHQMCSATPDGPCITDVINDAVINVDDEEDGQLDGGQDNDDNNMGDC
jgi:hypothetical protein